LTRRLRYRSQRLPHHLAEQRLEQRGLAAAVGTEQRQHLALGQLDVKANTDNSVGITDGETVAPAYRAAAMDRARQLAPVLAELMASGMSARQMAAELTARGIPTATGARWHTQTVLRMIDRVGC
jgi:hypothetical protein